MAEESNNKKTRETRVSAANGSDAQSKLHRKKKSGARSPINAFDIAVIVLVVLVAVVLTNSDRIRSLFRLTPDSRSCTVEYMVMFSDVDEEFAYAIVNGDAVYHPFTKAGMGTVSADAEVEAYRVIGYTDGESQMKEKPGAVNVIITIRAEAEYVKGVGYSVGGTPMRVGSTVTLRFPRYTGTGSCINISESGTSASGTQP